MNERAMVDELWRAGSLEPPAFLREIGSRLDPMVTGAAAYHYERIVTYVYGLEHGPDRPATPVTRWDVAAAELIGQAGTVAVRFFAFAVLATSLRRAANYRRLADTLRDAEPTLGEVPLFTHFRAMADVAQSYDTATMVRASRAAVERLGEHAGAHHTLALALIQSAELEEGGDRVRVLEQARRSVDRALRMDHDHPRFRLTKARATRLLGRLSDARVDILSAWHDDPAADVDADRRRLYEYELLLAEAALDLERRVGGIEKRVDDKVAGVEARAAQLAGFITGLVAITTVGAGLATQQPNAQSAVVVLLVIALLVFGGTIAIGLILARAR